MKHRSLIFTILLFVFCVCSCGENEPESVISEQHLKKIWVADEWDGGAYEFPVSFFFESIYEEQIEGKIAISSLAMPEYYNSSTHSPQGLVEISGTYRNNSAEFPFSINENVSGKLRVTARNDGNLDVTINFLYEDSPVEVESYVFRPYHLSDFEGVVETKEKILVVDNFDSWGSVHVVIEEIDSGRIRHPAVFLTDDQFNILYEFQASFHSGSEIIDYSVDDFNADGRKDLKLLSEFTEDENIKIEWILYQMENGLFYSTAEEQEQSKPPKTQGRQTLEI